MRTHEDEALKAFEQLAAESLLLSRFWKKTARRLGDCDAAGAWEACQDVFRASEAWRRQVRELKAEHGAVPAIGVDAALHRLAGDERRFYLQMAHTIAPIRVIPSSLLKMFAKDAAAPGAPAVQRFTALSTLGTQLFSH